MACSILPEYKTPGSAGFDLTITESYSLAPKELHNFHTGLRMSIPKDYCVLVFPRSSLGQKKVIIPNSVGVIDSDIEEKLKYLY
jgi:dUTP pyrophosphatase